MKNFGSILTICLFLLTSCASQYNIAGNSTVDDLDGRMLYLRVAPNNDFLMVNVDSCEVVHGRFKFFGDIDSVVVAHLYMDNECMMPVVLENGNLAIEVNNVGQRVSGSPLNDRLYRFIEMKTRLENEQWELDQLCLRMMREGKPIKEIHKEIGPKSKQLEEQIEGLEMQFIIDNYENALGPACFMLLFGQSPVPIMTDQIRQIVNTAPRTFLQNPFISNYLRQARNNSEMGEEGSVY